MVYEGPGSPLNKRCKNLILVNISKTLKTKLTDRPPSGPRLATGCHTCETDLKNTAKVLKTELILKSQSTEGWLELEAWTQPG